MNTNGNAGMKARFSRSSPRLASKRLGPSRLCRLRPACAWRFSSQFTPARYWASCRPGLRPGAAGYRHRRFSESRFGFAPVRCLPISNCDFVGSAQSGPTPRPPARPSPGACPVARTTGWIAPCPSVVNSSQQVAAHPFFMASPPFPRLARDCAGLATSASG